MAAEMEEERGLLLSLLLLLFDGSCVARVASSTTVNVKLDESISFCCFVYSDGSSSSQIIYYARMIIWYLLPLFFGGGAAVTSRRFLCGSKTSSGK